MSIFDQPTALINKQVPVTLAAGVGTINDAQVTTSSKATAQLVTPAGTLGANFKVVCTAGVVTVTSVVAAGTTQALDTSTLLVTITY